MIDAWKVTVKLDFFLCFCFSFSLSARPLRESSSSFSAPTRAFLLNNFNNLRWLIFPPFSKLHILIYFVACEKCWSRKLASACGWLGMTFLGKSLIETFRHDSLDDECREGGEMQQSKQITNDEWLWLEMEMQGSLSRMQNRLCVVVSIWKSVDQERDAQERSATRSPWLHIVIIKPENHSLICKTRSILEFEHCRDSFSLENNLNDRLRNK